MRTLVILTIAVMAGTAQAAPDAGNAFQLKDSGGGSKDVHGVKPSKIEPTKNDAAMKFLVIDKDKGPMKGIVVTLTSPTGAMYYGEETDAAGYTEMLVPNGQKYEITYLSLGRKDL